jgi:hypothetical protein
VPKLKGYQKQPEQSGWDEARDQPVLEVVDWWYGLHERMCHELQLRGHMDPRKGASPATPDALQCSSFDRERVWWALLHTTAALCAIPRPDGRACPVKKASEGAPSSISWRRYRSMHILHRSFWTPVPWLCSFRRSQAGLWKRGIRPSLSPFLQLRAAVARCDVVMANLLGRNSHTPPSPHEGIRIRRLASFRDGFA